MSARKLKDRLLGATPEQEPVTIAVADPAQADGDSAQEGILAIKRLVTDRNDAVKRAEILDRRVHFLLNVNNNERAKADYERARADHTLQLCAQLGVWSAQACEATTQMYNLLSQNAALVQRQPAPPKVTNNPELPSVIEAEPEFDNHGIPYNKANGVSNEQIKELISNLEERA
jgi:hypothetical protein